jgi:hypothetical protein
MKALSYPCFYLVISNYKKPCDSTVVPACLSHGWTPVFCFYGTYSKLQLSDVFLVVTSNDDIGVLPPLHHSHKTQDLTLHFDSSDARHARAARSLDSR